MRANWRLLVLVAVLMTRPASAFDPSSDPTFADQLVFINEIHYDNVGVDSGEGVEVAGPAGTDLTGWIVVLYDGATGQAYKTSPAVTTTLSADCGAFGLLSIPLAGIQNGSPSGIALVDASGQVIQFLSYEGSFTATNGAANGMTSVDIGVSEDGNGPVGQSLQLAGVGSSYGDFTWQPDAPSTFGACNIGETFDLIFRDGFE